jgi:magnesium-transporting ATPase (P-type)
MEAVKTFSGVFLSMDKKLEDKKTESTCGVLNCSLIEELGVIDFILTDKTGTLTAN